MKKKLLHRGLFGAPTGLLVFVCISLTAAHLRGDGELRVGHYLTQIYGNEVNAVTALILSAMAIGMIWSAASLIYETDWNLLVQTVVHGICCVVPSFFIARAMYWMPRNRESYLQYAVIFFVIYAVVWTIQYLGMRKRVLQMNAVLDRKKREE